jgi:hypothetical protein
MHDFYAVKHLAGSDLAWFRSLFGVYANTNLKGINLNADPTVTTFYRDLEAIADAAGGRVPVTASIYGPAAARAYTGTFKIVRSPGSKNWRLNGTLVDDPIGEAGRFNGLTRDDIAVLAFTGRPAPTHVGVVLLASGAPEDAALVAHFRSEFPKRGRTGTMFAIGPDDIAAAMAAPGVPPEHPLGLLIADPADAAVIEDAALGGSEGVIGRRRGARRRVTAADIASRRAAADRNGREGEALLDAYLSRSGASYEWTAEPEKGDGFAPFDFDVADGPLAGRIDAKTTDGPFERPFHMSLGEVAEAAESAEPYRIARIYQLSGEGARMRVSDDISALARRLLSAHDAAMFDGIRADAFTLPVDSAGISWGAEIELLPADAEDD